MPNWKEVLEEIQIVQKSIIAAYLQVPLTANNPMGGNHPQMQAQNQAKALGEAINSVRSKYVKKISDLTGRNIIAYYSGWLDKPNIAQAMIQDADKAAFMVTINKLDRSKGLDLILHTPGGDIAATESLVDYLHSMFGNDIRTIIPQIAMSAGTMVALSSKEIVMGKHSNLGPIDPQIGGLACEAVLQEFKDAIEDIKKQPQSVELWKLIIGKYYPTFLIQCQQTVDWSKSLAIEWLARNMFIGDGDITQANIRANEVMIKLLDHKTNKSHGRHFSKEQCREFGLNITNLEDNQDIQDAVLTAHHCFIHSFAMSPALKIVENNLGVTYIKNVPQQNMQNPLQQLFQQMQ